MTQCKEHPNYKAIQQPRVDCAACWDMYIEYNDIPFDIQPI